MLLDEVAKKLRLHIKEGLWGGTGRIHSAYDAHSDTFSQSSKYTRLTPKSFVELRGIRQTEEDVKNLAAGNYAPIPKNEQKAVDVENISEVSNK